MDTSEIRHFRGVLRAFERLTGGQIKRCCSGVTLAQCIVLFEIEDAGRPSLGQLASRLRLDNSTLSRTIDGLVGKGLVERRRDDQDRRVVWIQLTAEGSAICQSIHTANDAYCHQVFAKIPPSRRSTVIRNFETLVQAYLDCENESVSKTPRSSPRRTASGAHEK